MTEKALTTEGQLAKLTEALDRAGAQLARLNDLLAKWDTVYSLASRDNLPAREIHSLRMTATIFDQTRR